MPNQITDGFRRKFPNLNHWTDGRIAGYLTHWFPGAYDEDLEGIQKLQPLNIPPDRLPKIKKGETYKHVIRPADERPQDRFFGLEKVGMGVGGAARQGLYAPVTVMGDPGDPGPLPSQEEMVRQGRYARMMGPGAIPAFAIPHMAKAQYDAGRRGKEAMEYGRMIEGPEIVSDVSELTGQVASQVVAGPAALPAGVIQSASANREQVYDRLIEQGLTREEANEVADGVAVRSGAVTGALSYGMGKVPGLGKGVEAVAGKFTNQAIQSVLSNSLKTAVRKRAVAAALTKRFGANALGEGIEEAADEVINETANAMVLDSSLTFNKSLSQVIESGSWKKAFALGGLAGGVVGTAVEASPALEAQSQITSQADAARQEFERRQFTSDEVAKSVESDGRFEGVKNAEGKVLIFESDDGKIHHQPIIEGTDATAARIQYEEANPDVHFRGAFEMGRQDADAEVEEDANPEPEPTEEMAVELEQEGEIQAAEEVREKQVEVAIDKLGEDIFDPVRLGKHRIKKESLDPFFDDVEETDFGYKGKVGGKEVEINFVENLRNNDDALATSILGSKYAGTTINGVEIPANRSDYDQLTPEQQAQVLDQFVGAGAYVQTRVQGHDVDPKHVFFFAGDRADVGTLKHEAIHFLRKSGLMTAKEFDTLVMRYGDSSKNETENEEAVAYAYERWKKSRHSENVFTRFYDTFRPMFDFLKGPSARDIFHAIDKGQFKQREVRRPAKTAAEQDAELKELLEEQDAVGDLSPEGKEVLEDLSSEGVSTEPSPEEVVKTPPPAKKEQGLPQLKKAKAAKKKAAKKKMSSYVRQIHEFKAPFFDELYNRYREILPPVETLLTAFDNTSGEVTKTGFMGMKTKMSAQARVDDYGGSIDSEIATDVNKGRFIEALIDYIAEEISAKGDIDVGESFETLTHPGELREPDSYYITKDQSAHYVFKSRLEDKGWLFDVKEGKETVTITAEKEGRKITEKYPVKKLLDTKWLTRTKKEQEETERDIKSAGKTVSLRDTEFYKGRPKYALELAATRKFGQKHFPDDANKRAFDKELKGQEISQLEAYEQLIQWKAYAKTIGLRFGSITRSKTVISLYDRTGRWSEPFVDAGFEVIPLDLEVDDVDISQIDIEWIDDNIINQDIFAIIAAPPCTSFSVAGNKWDYDEATKERRAKQLAENINLVEHASDMISYLKPEIWALENPIGTIVRHAPHLGEPAIQFNPHNFGDPYTKLTQIWGSFNKDLPTANVAPELGSMVHKLRGDDPVEQAMRSVTPSGFAYAFFMANHKRFLDSYETENRWLNEEEEESSDYDEDEDEDEMDSYDTRDEEYMKAVESGDVETQQRLVDEEAKDAGYTVGPVFHGTDKNFNVFDTDTFGSWFATYENTAKNYADPENPRVQRAFLLLQKPLMVPYGIDMSQDVSARELVSAINNENGTQFTVDDLGYPSDYTGRAFEFLGSGGDVFISNAIDAGFDGIVAYELDELTYSAFNSEQIKSAEPITRDDAGNVIPLYKRFDEYSDDIRYSVQPRNADEQAIFDKAVKNKRSPELAVAANRMIANEISIDDYAALVDEFDPFIVKGPESVPSNDDILRYIRKDRRSKVGADVEEGEDVEVRIDIPTYNRSVARGKAVYAVTIHNPADPNAKKVGTPISYMGVAGVKNPSMVVRAISGQGSSIDIAAGSGKFPLATVSGQYFKVKKLPGNLSDSKVWTEASFNPIRANDFVDVRTGDRVFGGSEAIMVGSRVFVKNAKTAPRPTGEFDSSNPVYSVEPREPTPAAQSAIARIEASVKPPVNKDKRQTTQEGSWLMKNVARPSDALRYFSRGGTDISKVKRLVEVEEAFMASALRKEGQKLKKQLLEASKPKGDGWHLPHWVPGGKWYKRYKKFLDQALPIAAHLNVTGGSVTGGWEFGEFEQRVRAMSNKEFKEGEYSIGDTVDSQNPLTGEAEQLIIRHAIEIPGKGVAYQLVRPMDAESQKDVYDHFANEYPDLIWAIDMYIDPRLADSRKIVNGVEIPVFNRYSLHRMMFPAEPGEETNPLEGYTPDIIMKRTMWGAIKGVFNPRAGTKSPGYKYKTGIAREKGDLVDLFSAHNMRAYQLLRQESRLKLFREIYKNSEPLKGRDPKPGYVAFDQHTALVLRVMRQFAQFENKPVRVYPKLSEIDALEDKGEVMLKDKKGRIYYEKRGPLANIEARLSSKVDLADLTMDEKLEYKKFFGEAYGMAQDRQIRKEVADLLSSQAASDLMSEQTQNPLKMLFDWGIRNSTQLFLAHPYTYVTNIASNHLFTAELAFKKFFSGIVKSLGQGFRVNEDLRFAGQLVSSMRNVSGIKLFAGSKDYQKFINDVPTEELFEDTTALRDLMMDSGSNAIDMLSRGEVGSAVLSAIRYGKIDLKAKQRMVYAFLRAHAISKAKEQKLTGDALDRAVQAYMSAPPKEDIERAAEVANFEYLNYADSPKFLQWFADQTWSRLFLPFPRFAYHYTVKQLTRAANAKDLARFGKEFAKQVKPSEVMHPVTAVKGAMKRAMENNPDLKPADAFADVLTFSVFSLGFGGVVLDALLAGDDDDVRERIGTSTMKYIDPQTGEVKVRNLDYESITQSRINLSYYARAMGLGDTMDNKDFWARIRSYPVISAAGAAILAREDAKKFGVAQGLTSYSTQFQELAADFFSVGMAFKVASKIYASATDSAQPAKPFFDPYSTHVPLNAYLTEQAMAAFLPGVRQADELITIIDPVTAKRTASRGLDYKPGVVDVLKTKHLTGIINALMRSDADKPMPAGRVVEVGMKPRKGEKPETMMHRIEGLRLLMQGDKRARKFINKHGNERISLIPENTIRKTEPEIQALRLMGLNIKEMDMGQYRKSMEPPFTDYQRNLQRMKQLQNQR